MLPVCNNFVSSGFLSEIDWYEGKVSPELHSLFSEEKVWKVIRVHKRRAKLILISPPNTQKTVEVDNLRNTPILDPPIEVQIVSSRESEYLLLDPFTLQTVEAISPKDWKGSKVEALRYGNDTFFIWN